MAKYIMAFDAGTIELDEPLGLAADVSQEGGRAGWSTTPGRSGPPS